MEARVKCEEGRATRGRREKQRQCRGTMRELRKGNETQMGRALKMQVLQQPEWVRSTHQRQERQAKHDQEFEDKRQVIQGHTSTCELIWVYPLHH